MLLLSGLNSKSCMCNCIANTQYVNRLCQEEKQSRYHLETILHLCNKLLLQFEH